MARPRKCRKTFREPNTQCFKPKNSRNSRPILIGLDEFEAIRLKNYNKLSQKESAEKMNISQPTFHRILASAHFKIAKALIEGKGILIEGGNLEMNKKKYKCKSCDFEWLSEKDYSTCPDCQSEEIHEIFTSEDVSPASRGQMSQGRGMGMGRRAPRVCKCNDCGYELPKTPGIPCRENKCPNCNGLMCGSD